MIFTSYHRGPTITRTTIKTTLHYKIPLPVSRQRDFSQIYSATFTSFHLCTLCFVESAYRYVCASAPESVNSAIFKGFVIIARATRFRGTRSKSLISQAGRVLISCRPLSLPELRKVLLSERGRVSRTRNQDRCCGRTRWTRDRRRARRRCRSEACFLPPYRS